MDDPTRGLLDFAASLVALRQSGEAPPRPAVSLPSPSSALPAVSAARHALLEGGPDGYARWLRSSPRLLLADTTLERLQSRALGGRVRTADLARVAGQAVRLVPELAALEVTSAEAFGVALGESLECPFRRIEEVRNAAPGLLIRATLSAATALGREVAPVSAIKTAARELERAGVDVVRVVDPFNDADRLAAAVDAVASSGVVVEGVVTASGALHPSRSAGFVEGAIAVAATLERHGVLTVVVEDRFGALRPVAAYSVVRGIRREVHVPVWVRVVEATGYCVASALSAAEAGAIGVDTVLPSLGGVGFDPDAVAIAASLAGTERRPEPDPARLRELDRHVAALAALLGGSVEVPPTPPDAPDRGVPPDVLAEVLAAVGEEVSTDHAMSACEAAFTALGEPSPVAPAREGLVQLAEALAAGDEAAGRVLDRARADDPQGLLDSVASLREGGFPDTGAGDRDPSDRRAFLAHLWREAGERFRSHLERYGELELVAGEVLRHGLGAGEVLDAVVRGSPRRVRAVEPASGTGPLSLELDGEPVPPRS